MAMTKHKPKTEPKRAAKRSPQNGSKGLASYRKELTDEQLRDVSGGGGDPPIVRDYTNGPRK